MVTVPSKRIKPTVNITERKGKSKASFGLPIVESDKPAKEETKKEIHGE